jgi:ribonucleoside-diphosphate reductase alpha chain
MRYDEATVLEETTKYFKGDSLAASVWMNKYCLRDADGNYLESNPSQMHHRLATEFARIEAKYPNGMSYEEIRELFHEFKHVIPQGSPMYGIGNDHSYHSLGNCNVIPNVMDSYGSIIYTDQQLVQLMKRRCGVGVDISEIRPKGLTTSNAARTTDGIGVFMERFSNSCREVAQNGRRGALMLTISVHHPEIETFINIKRDLTKVTGANISIRLTDEFMNAAREGRPVELRWPVKSKTPTISRMVDAAKLWEQITESAWAVAEPGLLFWDRALDYSPSHPYGDKDDRFYNISTNPCSEIVMGVDSCRLLLLNTTGYVKNPFQDDAEFDFQLFFEHAQKAQRLMDDLIDIEIEKMDKILAKIESDPEPDHIKQVELETWKSLRETCLLGRRTGLGITGLGDAIAMLGMRYGSEKSIKFTDELYRHLANGAYYSSCIMAAERGAFPLFDHEVTDSFTEHLFGKENDLGAVLKELHARHGRRNIALLTTAPAGSVSILAQTTSGCEPVFMTHYNRRRKVVEGEEHDFVDALGDRWISYPVYHHNYKKWMDTMSPETLEGLEANEVQALSPYHNATANDVDWLASIDIQAAAQKWVDHAISKTVNLPEGTSRELVDQIYMRAWQKGLKGATVYVAGSRSGVLVSTEEKKEDDGQTFKQTTAPKRPEELPCDIHHCTIKGERMVVMVGLMDGHPYEVMGGKANKITLPKRFREGTLVKHPRKTIASKYDLVIGEEEDDLIIIRDVISQFDNAEYGTHTRLISLSLRHGAGIEHLVTQLGKDDSDMFGFSRVLARVLKKYIKDGTKASGGKACPECSSEDLAYQEGCLTCLSCGNSKCN